VAKVRLTDTYVSAVTPPAGTRLEVFDQVMVGLLLRVTDAGVKTWAVRYRTADGRQRRHTLGRYPGLKLREARAEALAVMTAARAGADPSAERVRARAGAKAEPLKTVKDLWEAYSAACLAGRWRARGKAKRASTMRVEESLWSTVIEPPLGALRVEEVASATVRSMLAAIADSGRGVTANRARAVVRQIFNYAVAQGRVATNPVAGVAAPVAERPRERVLVRSEIKKVWSVLSAPHGLTRPGATTGAPPVAVGIAFGTALALKLSLLTLARRAEVAGMRLAELDLARRVWTIPGARTKNGRTHVLPLSPMAVTIIKEAAGLGDDGEGLEDGPIFPSPHGTKSITPDALSGVVRDLPPCLGLQHFTLHDWRRTGASMMVAELGVSPFIVGQILNHAGETGGAASVTIRHYALHDYAAEKRSALEAWAAHLGHIVQ
jgi:integrase